MLKPGSALIISVTHWEIIKNEDILVTNVLEKENEKKHKF